MNGPAYDKLYQSSREIGWDVDDLDPEEYERRCSALVKTSHKRRTLNRAASLEAPQPVSPPEFQLDPQQENQGDAVPALSRADLEEIAQRVIKAYTQLPQFEGYLGTRIDIELMVKELFGYRVEYHRLSLDGKLLGVTGGAGLGVQVFDNGKPEFIFVDGKTIFLDSSLSGPDANRGYRNFSLAHELGHQIIMKLYPRAYSKELLCRHAFVCSLKQNKSEDFWEEWRANVLAAALLMPEQVIRGNMRIFHLNPRIDADSRWSKEVFHNFCQMADYMGVSRRALKIRLEQLGLLDKEPTVQVRKQYPVIIEGDEEWD